MATINLSDAYATARYEFFEGINGLREASEGSVFTDIKNFRANKTGHVSVRNGYSFALGLPDPVRALQVISDTEALVLAGGMLYRADLAAGTTATVKEFEISDGDAYFFTYGNLIYLLDGDELYVYNGDTLSPVSGYVPLYAKESAVGDLGPVYEPLNLLSNRYRVSYKVGSTVPNIFPFPFPVASIDGVFRNGVKDNSYNYNLSVTKDYAEAFIAFNVGDVVEFHLTMASSPLSRRSLTSCTRAVVFGSGKSGAESASVGFYRGVSKDEIFTTRHIDPADMERVREIYGDISTLYVSDKDSASAGNEITAASVCGSALCVFTHDSAYLTEENSGYGPKLIKISSTFGCSAKDCAISFENSPLTVSDTGILRWQPHQVYDGEYTAKCISLPVCHLLPIAPSSGVLCCNRTNGELWFHLEGSERTFIYNYILSAWYTFDGFSPDFFFELNGHTGFVSDNGIFVFNEQLNSDITADGTKTITAVAVSNLLSFGDINQKKRLSRVILRGYTSSRFTLRVKDDKGRLSSVCMNSSPSGYWEKRLPTRKSKYYSFELTNEGGNGGADLLILAAVK